MNHDEKWMKYAIEEAYKAKDKGEIPVGAVLVKSGKILAKAHNLCISNNDASAHAEIQLIRNAGKIFKNYRLKGSIIYVTLEPCAMCFGAMIHARINRLVFGAFDPKTGVCGSCGDLTNEIFFNHKIDIIGGVLKSENEEILKRFFKQLRSN
jgi:tRNA(Arg) A34 adenosine deaminase TadA